MAASRRVVVDCSVIIKWVLPEPGRSAALTLLDDYEAGRTDLLAPRLIMEEAASALSKRCRRGDLTPAQARRAFGMLELRQPLLIDQPEQVKVALELSVLHHLSFWDSVYLAVAIAERCGIVTADLRFRSGIVGRYPFVTLLGQT